MKPEKKRSQKGATTVEFAILLPVLLLFIFGILEFGLLLFNKQVITTMFLKVKLLPKITLMITLLHLVIPLPLFVSGQPVLVQQVDLISQLRFHIFTTF
jgi:hypothetical protein